LKKITSATHDFFSLLHWFAVQAQSQGMGASLTIGLFFVAFFGICCWCWLCGGEFLFAKDDEDEEYDHASGQRSKIRHEAGL